MKTIKSWSELKSQLTAQITNVSNFIDRCQGISFPVVYTSEDNSIIFYWNGANHYIDVEFTKNGKYEWFYKNREADAVLGTEDGVDDVLPEQVFELLNKHFKEQQ